ncbi:hypothetical protein [Silvania hatchlandensis]|uniref:Uncharacterized protein n=1 Tax=Silvania hatchlandensis TaxID=2926469 RepID=A0A9J6Q6P6_9ENTR|nr:hypothetical protein [Silvania hatchlandensis]MCU6665198.1 hypothetical protein [Silvania hatchlandensis]
MTPRRVMRWRAPHNALNLPGGTLLPGYLPPVADFFPFPVIRLLKFTQPRAILNANSFHGLMIDAWIIEK